MLNVPVAFFAQPLNGLVHDDVNKWGLVALLLGGVTLWSYIGWRIDSRYAISRPRNALRILAVVMGCVFALLVLIQTITMFHVGLFYKVIAVLWSVLMVRHFLHFLGDSEHRERPNVRRKPRLTLNVIATFWAGSILLGALALSPRDSSGAPSPTLAHVFAVCYLLLLLATAYGVIAHLISAWRAVRVSENGRSCATWVGLDTFLAVIGVVAVGACFVRG